MHVLNPFHFGVVVSGNDFCNREEEIEELQQDIKNHQNNIIYSPRRYGKTSLIYEVFRRLSGEKQIQTIYVNIYSILSETDFVELYHRALFKSLTKTPRTVMEQIGRYLKSIRPKITVNPDGTYDVGIEYMPEITAAVEDIMAVPLRYAEETGKSVVIAFDEFQQIARIQNFVLEKKIRNIIQEQSDKIAYIFLGSKRHVMEEMFSNPNRPFYRAGKQMPLKKIDRKQMILFIIEKFLETGKRISNNLAEDIIGLADNHPYYIQHLSHIIWDLAENEVHADMVQQALDYTLNRESVVFTEFWDRLSLNQRKVLVALNLKNKDEGIFSQAVSHRFKLPPVSSLQKSLKTLYGQELIEKVNGDYQITDVFFRLWIKRNYTINPPYYLT